MNKLALVRTVAVGAIALSGIAATGQMLRTGGAVPRENQAQATAQQQSGMPNALMGEEALAPPTRLTQAQWSNHVELNAAQPISGEQADYGASDYGGGAAYDAAITNASGGAQEEINPSPGFPSNDASLPVDGEHDPFAATQDASVRPAQDLIDAQAENDSQAPAYDGAAQYGFPPADNEFAGQAAVSQDAVGVENAEQAHDAEHVQSAYPDHSLQGDPYASSEANLPGANTTGEKTHDAGSPEPAAASSHEEHAPNEGDQQDANETTPVNEGRAKRTGAAAPLLGKAPRPVRSTQNRKQERMADASASGVIEGQSAESMGLANDNNYNSALNYDGGNAADSIPSATEMSAGVGIGKVGPRELDGPQSTTLAVTKIAPIEVQVGAAEKYRISIRNSATTTAKNVRVIDEVPEHARFVKSNPSPSVSQGGVLEWEIAEIRPGGQFDIEMELVALEEGEIGSVARVVSTHQAGMRTKATRPQLALNVSSPKRVLKGQNVTFSVKVANSGTGVARNVVLEEIVPEQLEHPDGRELELAIDKLNPGEVRQFDLTLKAAQAGQVINRLVARGAGDLSVRQDVELEVIAPALEVAVNGPKYRYLDTKAVFGITVSNPGTAQAEDVMLTVKLPAGLEFVEANNAGYYNAEKHVVAWSLVSLPEGRAGDVKLVTKPTKAGEFAIKVDARSGRDLTAEMEHPLKVDGLASLTFSVTDLEDPIEVGSETTYEIRVSNPGSKAASNIRIVGIAPAGMRIIEGKGSSPNQIQGDHIVFGPIASLNPKAEATFQVRVAADAEGDLRMRVEISSDEVQPVVKEEPTKVYSAE